MNLVWICATAIGLSMDAFAVSVCKGLAMHRIRWGQAALIAVMFGLFQGGMPIIGWALGSTLAALIEPIDHWIIFAILVLVGANMVWDGLHDDPSEARSADGDKLDMREILMLALATSIDALAVGVSFALMSVNIWIAAAIIAAITTVLSFAGVFIGHFFGARFEKPATIAGGIVLILIGVKVLLEHLGIISF